LEDSRLIIILGFSQHSSGDTVQKRIKSLYLISTEILTQQNILTILLQPPNQKCKPLRLSSDFRNKKNPATLYFMGSENSIIF